ncbi:PREDICTED: epidermal growth factor receptor substrate 15-like [Brassica oleracea var. oleracea]|uniref:Uncharacterized protein n=1 Tax=Brassica oleracea var. oleracea TaxID=109376 RepID=A0A0D3DQM3_BRAOL|nr:PREDICTED: epidermal growth factor receptor substrate 15-like [Brassica oleracea var. oleracea]
MAGLNPNMDQFEAYFNRADLDGDGRISGVEAVGFFQGSGLPKPVLFQIWSLSDRSGSGFLGRQDFYNSLRLVTVAQSKRDLTPEIVNAALNTPAAAKIPAPKINLLAIPAPQPNPPATTARPVSSPGHQNVGVRGPGAPNANVNQNYFPPQQSQQVRPHQGASVLTSLRPNALPAQFQPVPVGSATRPPQTIPTSAPGPAGSEYRPSALPGQFQPGPVGSSTRPPQAVPTTASGPGASAFNLNNLYAGNTSGYSSGFVGGSLAAPSPGVKPESQIDPKALVVSGNGGDIFSSFQQKPQPTPSSSSISSAIVPASAGTQPPPKPNTLDYLQSTLLPAGPQLPRPAASSQGPSSGLPHGSAVGSGHPTPAGNNQPPWPKMKPSDVQKYTKVFIEVDSDRDGRITGEQARNLFLSWRLPREVLKHVWELSDQDNDTMLSLREFCISLYLMERYKEGRPLPPELPSSIMYDETLLSISGAPIRSYANAGWGYGQGFVKQPVMGARPTTPPTGMRPPVPAPAPHPGSGIASNQERNQAPALDDPFASHLGNGYSASSNPPETATDGEKVDEKKNAYMDSREKLEYYRTKMQDIVLYKTRCDNRLNEICERASADKHEAETLAKKYEEKYKQVAELGSKLTIEEARFREIEGRKMELSQAIVNMEQGGSADGLLQVRADRIQSDLEELMKALTERCKKHGLEVKSKALVDLPAGWQPGIQEGAALWDEEWDKFEDEEFGNEITFDKSKEQKSSGEKENGTVDDGSGPPDSPTHLDENYGPFSETSDRHHESEGESGRSPGDSPVSRTATEVPSPDYAHEKSSEFFDDSNWASAFDTNDDVDSVWGFDASKSQDGDYFGENSGRADSPTSRSFAGQRKSTFGFDDSVPSTPLSRFGNSPPRFSDASTRDNNNFDSFSRFDSFNHSEAGGAGFTSSQPERLSRSDSINSSKDFGGAAFSRFDSINSSRDFAGGAEQLSRFDSINSSRDFGGPSLSRFDSMNSTKDFSGSHGYSFDDADPFGSTGPFKVYFDDKSPKKNSF